MFGLTRQRFFFMNANSVRKVSKGSSLVNSRTRCTENMLIVKIQTKFLNKLLEKDKKIKKKKKQRLVL